MQYTTTDHAARRYFPCPERPKRLETPCFVTHSLMPSSEGGLHHLLTISCSTLTAIVVERGHATHPATANTRPREHRGRADSPGSLPERRAFVLKYLPTTTREKGGQRANKAADSNARASYGIFTRCAKRFFWLQWFCGVDFTS